MKTKRNSLLALLLMMIITLASCSKESQYEKRIVGKWYCFEEKTDPDALGVIHKGYYYQFMKSGMVYLWEEGYESETASTRYEIKDETLFIDYLITWPYTIDELSKTTMILKQSGDRFSLQKKD